MLSRIRYQRLVIITSYLLAALYLTAPLYSSFSTRILGGETGEAYESARHIWWFTTALRQGQNVFDHALLGYPAGYPVVQLWAHPLQFFPAWLFAFVLPLAAAYNATVLLTLVLNAWSMYLLARRRLPTSHVFPAFATGLVFMAFPAAQGHLVAGQPGLLVLWPLPLFIICLFDYADDGGSRRYLSALLFFLLSALGNTLQIVYLLVPLAALFLLARVYRRDQVGAIRLLAVVLVGCLLLFFFVSPVLGDMRGHPAYSDDSGVLRDSVDLLAIVRPSSANPFWADIVAPASGSMPDGMGSGRSYIGLLGGILALLGMMSRRETRWWLLLALAAWLLALGPILKVSQQALTASIAGYDAVVPLPLAFLLNLPLFEFALKPSRFMLLFALAFALLAGFGMSALWSSRIARNRHRYAQYVLAFLLALGVLEDYKLYPGFPTLPAEIPNGIHALERRRDIRAIYNAPYDDLPAARHAMYLQTAHGKAIIAGHDAIATTADPARLELLQGFQPALLAEADADVVIINKARARETGQLDLLSWRAQTLLGEPFYDDPRFALYETPFTRDAPSAVLATTANAQSHSAYIYKAQPGWLEFSAILEAVNRTVHLTLNDTPLESLNVNGRIPLSIPLPIARRGYHILRIAQDPPCPERIDTTLLVCQRVSVEDVDIRVLSSGAIYDPIRMEGGIVLAGYFLPQTASDAVSIRLWWQFEADRTANDVRFVHILDANGLPVPERPADRSFGKIETGTELTETVTLDAGKLAAGEYSVLTGWYALPDAIRYDVLTNVDGAQNDTIVLGSIRVSE